MKSKKKLIAILIAVAVVLTGIVINRDVLVAVLKYGIPGWQDEDPAYATMPIILRKVVSPDTDKSLWVTETFKGCGRKRPNVVTQVLLPPDWVLESKREYGVATSYVITNGDSTIDIQCGEGFGGASCSENVIFEVNQKSHWACFVSEAAGRKIFITGEGNEESSYYVSADYKDSDEDTVFGIIASGPFWMDEVAPTPTN